MRLRVIDVADPGWLAGGAHTLFIVEVRLFGADTAPAAQRTDQLGHVVSHLLAGGR